MLHHPRSDYSAYITYTFQFLLGCFEI